MKARKNTLKVFAISVFLLIFVIGGTNLSSVFGYTVTNFHYEKRSVNGHSGYITEWRIAGALDKPVIVLLGFDPDNSFTTDTAISQYSSLINTMTSKGFDVIIFDYVDGDLWLGQQAQNLADFIRYLDGYFTGNYRLAVAGASMGGIVARTMFVQENSNMGVDIFITLDSPHYGVYISGYVSWLSGLLFDFFTITPAGQQMYHGSDLYNQHYGWLQSVEKGSWFKANVIGPMTTAAFALSNGEGRWSIGWGGATVNTIYHPVASYITVMGITVDFIPYHSAVYSDNVKVNDKISWFKYYYWYESTATSYFDYKIASARGLHDSSNFNGILSSGMDFIINHW